jgi:predicted permease
MVAVASLAIGIAGNAVIFSLADALLLRPKPGIADPWRLVDVGRTDNGEGFDTFSYPDYLEYRDRNVVLDGLAAHRDGEPFGLSVDGGAVRVFGGQVSANYFDVLGTPLALGRGFLPQEERVGNPVAVVVISHRLWREQFGGDDEVIGRTIRLNGRPFTVVGVTAAGFSGYSFASEALWVPLTAYPEGENLGRLSMRQSTWLMGVGRLRSGVTVEQAQGNLEAIARDIEREYAESIPGRGLAVARSGAVPQIVRPAVSGFVAVLFALVGVILLIACTNIGGMLLARGVRRAREVALRVALGAERGRIVRLLATESVLLAGGGAVIGVAAAWVLIRLLSQLVPVLPIDVVVDFRVDWRVAAFSTAVAILAGLLSGVVPAVQASRVDLAAATKPSGASGAARGRARQVFVVAQISLSVLLVVCALLLARSLRSANTIDPGFVPEGVEVAGLDLRLGGYDEVTGPLFAEQLLARTENLPFVQSAASTRVVPLTMTGYSQGWLWLPEHQVGDVDRAIRADWNLVTPGFFETIGTPLVEGRSFDARDDARARDVVIVNETLARRVWPGQDPIGRSLVFPGERRRVLEVIGVARDAKYQTLGEEVPPFVYVPLAQHYHPEMWLLVRTAGPSVLPALRDLLREMNPNLPLVRASSLSEATAFGLVPSRLAAWVASVASAVGVLLTALGVYGVTAYDVGRRTREIGIRIAVGALRRDVVRMVMRQAMTLAAVGLAIGVGLAVVSARFLDTLLYGVEPLDGTSFVGAVLLMTALALTASLVPARRAASVNPVEVLKGD